MCFLDRPQKIFFYFAVFDQFNVLLLIMLLHCHKIGEYLNKDHSFQKKFWSIRGEWQINSAVTYKRKGGPNCFEQGSYNFSCKKRRAEEANPKGPAVSYQRNHYLKELLTWMSFVVEFVTSVYTLSSYGIFYVFKMNVSASHATARSLLQTWRI